MILNINKNMLVSAFNQTNSFPQTDKTEERQDAPIIHAPATSPTTSATNAAWGWQRKGKLQQYPTPPHDRLSRGQPGEYTDIIRKKKQSVAQ